MTSYHFPGLVITKYFTAHDQMSAGGNNFGCICVTLNLIIPRILGSVSPAKHLLSNGKVRTIKDNKL
jgi:hypothetical protein